MVNRAKFLNLFLAVLIASVSVIGAILTPALPPGAVQAQLETGTPAVAPSLSRPASGAPIASPDGWEWQNPLPQGNHLYGVWGTSSSDVFAVGDYGTILHYDGSSWSWMSSGTTRDLLGVWGSSHSDVFAVGWLGTILHYDGSAWSPMSSGATTVPPSTTLLSSTWQSLPILIDPKSPLITAPGHTPEFSPISTSPTT